jgi:hypothetical protein
LPILDPKIFSTVSTGPTTTTYKKKEKAVLVDPTQKWLAETGNPLKKTTRIKTGFLQAIADQPREHGPNF